MRTLKYVLCGLIINSLAFAAMPVLKFGNVHVATSTNEGTSVDASTTPTVSPTTNGTTNPDLNSNKGVYVPPSPPANAKKSKTPTLNNPQNNANTPIISPTPANSDTQ